MGRRTRDRGSTAWGTGLGINDWPVVDEPASPSEFDVDPVQFQGFLEDEAKALERQRYQIEQRISRLEKGHKLVALVLSEKCAGCGICTDVCMTNAIEIKEHAIVNTMKCIGCGNCVSECPNEAIILTAAKHS